MLIQKIKHKQEALRGKYKEELPPGKVERSCFCFSFSVSLPFRMVLGYVSTERLQKKPLTHRDLRMLMEATGAWGAVVCL